MTTGEFQNLDTLPDTYLKELQRQIKDLLGRRNANGSPAEDTEHAPELDDVAESAAETDTLTDATLPDTELPTLETAEQEAEVPDFPEVLDVEAPGAAVIEEETEASTQKQDEPVMIETPAIEVKLDEIYTIKVVADEVIKNVDQLQQEVADLRAQVSGLIGREVLESEVERLVRQALRGI
jgi:hypothetical protein